MYHVVVSEDSYIYTHINILYKFGSVQFSSAAQSCLTLCDPMNHSMPGLPVRHQLPEFTQIHDLRRFSFRTKNQA